MGVETGIEWTDATFNPWIGCTRAGPGCDFCYAEKEDKRRKWTLEGWGPGKPRRRTSGAYWKGPIKWNREAEASGKPLKVFGGSLCDPFDKEAPEGARTDYWRLIKSTPHLTWQIVTKRIGNAPKMLPEDWGAGYPNVWLIATICNQDEADRDIPKLLATPAALRGLSMEPLLGPVDLSRIVVHGCDRIDALRGVEENHPRGTLDCPRLDWVIVGGESGPNARPMHPDWARSLRDQCQAAGVPFFFKQWGEYLPVGQSLPGCGKVHGATAVKPGRMKLHYGGAPQQAPKHAFAEHGVEFVSTSDGRLTFRVGKKAAGAMLDGREWREFPK